MQPQQTDIKGPRKGIGRCLPFRLFDWIDNQKSWSKRRICLGLVLAGILSVCGIAWQHTDALIHVPDWFLSLLKSPVQLALWLLLLCILFPLGVLWLIYLVSSKNKRIYQLQVDVSYLSSGLLIHSARYGAGDVTVDVAPYLQRQIAQGYRKIPVGDNLLDGGKDPCPCVEKDLIVEFSRMGEKQPKKIHQTTTPNYFDLT